VLSGWFGLLRGLRSGTPLTLCAAVYELIAYFVEAAFNGTRTASCQGS